MDTQQTDPAQPVANDALVRLCPACGSAGEFMTGRKGSIREGQYMAECKEMNSDNCEETDWRGTLKEAAEEWERIAKPNATAQTPPDDGTKNL